MALRIREFPVAREFPEPREIPVTREFPRLKLFAPVSRETGISREFPARGFPLNITEPTPQIPKLPPVKFNMLKVEARVDHKFLRHITG